MQNSQVNNDTSIVVSTATGRCVMTVGQFVVEYGIPTLDQDNPKCHFQNRSDVTLFKMQLAEQGLATVSGFEIKLANAAFLEREMLSTEQIEDQRIESPRRRGPRQCGA